MRKKKLLIRDELKGEVCENLKTLLTKNAASAETLYTPKG
jgi:hypothetical protein